MKKLNRTLFLATLILLFFSLLSGNALAAQLDDYPAQTIHQGNVSLEPKDDFSTQAIVVGLPGTLAYHGSIPNGRLPAIIQSRDRKTLVTNWVNWALTPFYAPAAWSTFVNAGASQIAGSPTARLQEAYHKGESVYYGGYYPDNKVGLTTIPFIYYSTVPLDFR